MARALTPVALALAVVHAAPALAQSSASFPPEPEAAPPAPAPAPPPPAAPPPAAPPPAPAPAAPPPATPGSWLEQRGPEVAGPPPPTFDGAAPAPAGPGDPRPPILPYRDGLPVPPGYHVEERSASGLMIGGALLFGASYGGALLLASGEDFENGTGWLALPVFGPWAAVGARDFSCGPVTAATTNKCVSDAFDEVGTIVFIAIDGLVQATSVGLLIAGAASGKEELVRDDLKVGFVPPLPGRRDARFGVSGAF